MRPLLLAVLLVVPFGGSVQAATIFDNFGPGYSYDESGGWSVNGPTSSGIHVASAMSFVPTGTYALDSIAVAMVWRNAPTDLLDLAVHGDVGGVPGGAPVESWVIGGMAQTGTDNSPVWAVWAISTLNPVLSAGTQYWLVAEATTKPSAELAWCYDETGDLGMVAQRMGAGDWTAFPLIRSGAFQVNGLDTEDIPEPSTLALLGLGIGALALRRRRRQA